MSGSNVQLLAQAHAYIEAGNLEDAENLIRSLLEQEPDNTDAWWLLAHSVRDSDAAREALFQVLRLDPNDQQARSLLSALDERFPDEAGSSGGSRLRLPRPRFSLPGRPTAFLPSGVGGLATPVSYLVLLVLLVVGGWLLLRYLGLDLQLIPAAPAVTETATADVTETGSAATFTATAAATQAAGVATFTVTAAVVETAAITTGTAPAAITATLDAQQTVEGVEATTETGQAVPALAASADDAGASPAPVTAAVIPPSPSGEQVAGTPAGDDAEVTQEPTIEPSPVPTYPYPTQIDPAEFAAEYAAAFAEAGLQLAVDIPLMEGSQFGSTALAGVCLDADSGLLGTIDAAMAVMGGFAAQLNNSAPALGVRVIDCDDGTLVRVIAAPLQTALEWSDGTIDLAAWQSEWRAVG